MPCRAVLPHAGPALHKMHALLAQHVASTRLACLSCAGWPMPACDGAALLCRMQAGKRLLGAPGLPQRAAPKEARTAAGPGADIGYGVLWQDPAAVQGATLLQALLDTAWCKVRGPAVRGCVWWR